MLNLEARAHSEYKKWNKKRLFLKKEASRKRSLQPRLDSRSIKDKWNEYRQNLTKSDRESKLILKGN